MAIEYTYLEADLPNSTTYCSSEPCPWYKRAWQSLKRDYSYWVFIAMLALGVVAFAFLVFS